MVSDDDVLNYEEDKSEDDSAVIVDAGEQLCEIDLLDGVLVHSAANYADILASMVSPTPEEFVARMNDGRASPSDCATRTTPTTRASRTTPSRRRSIRRSSRRC